AGSNAIDPEPNAGTGGTPVAALCQHFANIWQQRQAEREPGEPIPPEGAPAPCFECLRAQETSCHRPQAECAANSACIDRHCLCTKEQPVAAMCNVATYPDDLCDCIHACTPAADTDCEDQWHGYMRCAVAACAAVCD
ncbi:MAG TPA: hypothetical protein VHM25_08250, partial [Polyangiaceae bacterium]|nr:hypothetical protein [Polyangiaceae bacterium]